MDLGRLDDDELIALIESGAGGAALEELFRRMRDEAEPGKQAYVEAVIERLRWTFAQDDEDDGDAAGVREPRRPPPDYDAGVIRLAS